MNNLTVPFEISDINHGFQKASGLLKWEQNRLIFEFQVEDAFVGVFKSDVKEVVISVSDLQNVEFKKKFFSARLIIEAKSLKVFEDLPGTQKARCELKISRGDRNKAARLASNVQLALSEHRLNQMGDMD